MSASPLSERIGMMLAPDGRVSRMLLTILQHVESSIMALVCLVPAFAFYALVGWQPTHLAAWLGVTSLLPAGPVVFALLSVSRDFLAEEGYPGRGIRRFVGALRRGTRALAPWWLLAWFVGLMLAYQLALFGASDGVFIGVVAGLAVLLLGSIGLSCAVLAGSEKGMLGLVAEVARAAAARPHVLGAWLLLGTAVPMAGFVPLIGTSLVLLLPGLFATGLLVVNAMTGFDTALQRRIQRPSVR